MSRITCSWVDEDAESWYLDKHIPDVVESLATTARHATLETSEAARDMFKEVAGIEGKHITIYDLNENADARDINAQIQAARNKLQTDAKIDTRIYDHHATMYGEHWSNDLNDIQMLVVVLWQPDDVVHADFLEWLRTEFMPGVLQSPEGLRSSIYELQHASLAEKGGVEIQNASKMKPYMTIWEFDCTELPWDVLVNLASKEGWRKYVEGGQVQWEIGMYVVSRIYPGTGESHVDVEKANNN